MSCLFVLFCFVIMTARFGLAAPLVSLDQHVHLTALQGQGEGGEGRGAVLFRLTAKGIRLWQILSFLFVFLYFSQHVAFCWSTPNTARRNTHQVYQQLKDDAMLHNLLYY